MKLNKKIILIAATFCVLLITIFGVDAQTVLLGVEGTITDGNLIQFKGYNGTVEDVGIAVEDITDDIKTTKYDATSAPTENDDSVDGYEIGSKWFDVTADKGYVCLDATESSAIWTEITSLGTKALAGLTEDVDLTGLDDDMIIQYDSAEEKWRAAAFVGGVESASNIGGEIELFKQLTGTDLEFRTLKAGSTKVDISNSELLAWVNDNNSYSISYHTSPYGFAFRTDGTQFYVYDRSWNRFYRYGMTEAWDVTTASRHGTYTTFSALESDDENGESLCIAQDGEHCYVLASNNYVYQYTLNTAWDHTSVTYEGKGVVDVGYDSFYVEISSDGSKLYVSNEYDNKIYQYDFGVNWDITTLENKQSFDPSSEDDTNQGIAFSSDGSFFIMSGHQNDSFYKYSMGTNWDITTAEYSGSSYSWSGIGAYMRFDLAVGSSDSKLFTIDSDKDVYTFTIGGVVNYDYIEIDVDPSEIDLLDLGDTPSEYDDGKFLKSTASAFELVSITSDDLTDVDLTSPAEGDLLYYDGNNWINLGIGTTGQVLTVSAGGVPEWATP